ncbi:hypothetical protein [Alkalinema sp. FACHB-956]|uniref:hypothetical protein n=1 Tax=Alkalinema sp. FACHB-956 TaxID=2692768 RepID=UPI001687DD26|nr:hypothetical protein [Alkalinema sp. FACHB-956]MBD2326089.1 hypothetical protein [Alkalinema sp. FACHB-956]
MLKHFVLNLNPNAKFDWERCTLQNPITGEQPTIAGLVAQLVGEQPGSYLVAVNLEVTVLEQVPIEPVRSLSRRAIERSIEPTINSSEELANPVTAETLAEIAA